MVEFHLLRKVTHVCPKLFKVEGLKPWNTRSSKRKDRKARGVQEMQKDTSGDRGSAVAQFMGVCKASDRNAHKRTLKSFGQTC
jgi:hypothetical protein